MEFLHPAMWHDHDIDFARWLHPAMWHVALGSWQWIHQVAVPCNVACGSGIMTVNLPGGSTLQREWHVALGSWHQIHQEAAPCNVTGGSGMTCHWVHPNVRHIGILLLVSISTISPQSTCHSAPVCKILSKSDHTLGLISAILGFMGPMMGSLKSPCTSSYRSSIETVALNYLSFWDE